MQALSLDVVAAALSRHLPVYRWRKPVYQTAMLNALRAMWEDNHREVLDVGGGTGVIAQIINDTFPVDRVTSIDVEQRFLETLTIATSTFDGCNLPFPDDSFTCVVLNNVVHHVKPQHRVALLRECRRVAPRGVIYLKDHIAANALDRFRLTVLDVVGNVPFSGMVRAEYLSEAQWQTLASESGFRIAERAVVPCRRGPLQWVFPNTLEIAMKLRPAE